MSEEKSSGGFSLRKKRSVRPKISAPRQQISAPIVPTLPANVERSTLAQDSKGPPKGSDNGENTVDYVKRRYSTRIPQLPRESLDAPSIPSIPERYNNNGGQSPPDSPLRRDRRKSSGPREKILVNLRALQDPDLRAEQYVAQLLANASEADIREYQHELNRLKNRTSTDIQHNVYENRSQFLKISQEADKLKTEMRALRALMSDLTNTLGQTNAALGISTDTAASTRYAHRSSVANLEAMWSSHLQELWRRVEGSQKYLPAIPGRHVVHESGRWVELNTATLRPRRRVHLILLNDHLLVALEKKRLDQPTSPDTEKPRNGAAQPASQPHFVTDRCWPLQDIEISDISSRRNDDLRKSDRPIALNAINVRTGADSFTYTVSDSERGEKATLLSKIRKELAELRKTSLVANGGDDEQAGAPARPTSSHGRKSARLSGGAGAFGDANASEAGGSATAGKPGTLVDLDGRQHPFRWLEVQVDDLDIDIALQHFGEAVDGVERLRGISQNNRGNAAVQELISGRVQDCAGRLARALIREMVGTSAWMSATQTHVAALTRLGFEARASEAFLEARSEVVRTRTSQCLDEGDLQHYLYSLSYIYFTLVRNTLAIYQACFAPSMASAAVKWAKGHVEAFNALLGLHLRKLDPAGHERRECLEKAREHAGVLAEVGIDFKALVGAGLGGEGGG